jgi:hypothetical protein
VETEDPIRIQIVRLLLLRGAEIDTADNDGDTPGKDVESTYFWVDTADNDGDTPGKDLGSTYHYHFHCCLHLDDDGDTPGKDLDSTNGVNTAGDDGDTPGRITSNN